MSYDRQIDQECPHGVVQEFRFVSRDAQTIQPIRPIASSGSVVVRLNGEIEIPPTGVYHPASVLSSRTGPFTITTGVNDTVVLSVGSGPNQTVVLPASSNLPLGRIADTLNRGLRGVLFSEQKGRLCLRTTESGVGATVFVRPASSFLSSIGVPVNREFRGRVIAPGWNLIRDNTTLSDRPRRNIVFTQPLAGFGDYVEIDYTTVRQECRRCGGTGFEHDWRYVITGEVVQVVDEALLIQEAQKIVFTMLGSNPFHEWYGTRVLDAVGKKFTPTGVLQNIIVGDIQTAFRRWQSVKRQQEEVVGQEVSDREYPLDASVSLHASSPDPTVLLIRIVIRNRSSDPIVLERGVRLPLPLDLLGQTPAHGTIRRSTSDFVLTG